MTKVATKVAAKVVARVAPKNFEILGDFDILGNFENSGIWEILEVVLRLLRLLRFDLNWLSLPN